MPQHILSRFWYRREWTHQNGGTLLLLQNEKSYSKEFLKSEGKVVITLSQTAFQMNSTSAVCQTKTKNIKELLSLHWWNRWVFYDCKLEWFSQWSYMINNDLQKNTGWTQKTYTESFLDCVSLFPLLRWSTELLVLLRIRTGMEEDGVEEIEEATLKWCGRRLSSGKQMRTAK